MTSAQKPFATHLGHSYSAGSALGLNRHGLHFAESMLYWDSFVCECADGSLASRHLLGLELLSSGEMHNPKQVAFLETTTYW